MKAKRFVGAAVLASSLAGPALPADLPLYVTKAPSAFSWSGCYLGAHGGGGWLDKSLTDPVQLAQDTVAGGPVTTGTTTTTLSAGGVLVGGQIGCDYQFAPAWVAGIEGAASGATMKASTTVGLPAGLAGDSALVTTRTDFLSSATVRLGYAVDRWLLFAKGGPAWEGGKYDVTGSFAGTPFAFEGLDQRFGWTAGAGVEWAFSGHWSAKLEYDYYGFGHGTVRMTDPVNGSGTIDVKQSAQAVKFGLNFHMWDGQ